MTKHFAQGRDLIERLADVQADSPWYERLVVLLFRAEIALWVALGVAILVALLLVRLT